MFLFFFQNLNMPSSIHTNHLQTHSIHKHPDKTLNLTKKINQPTVLQSLPLQPPYLPQFIITSSLVESEALDTSNTIILSDPQYTPENLNRSINGSISTTFAMITKTNFPLITALTPLLLETAQTQPLNFFLLKETILQPLLPNGNNSTTPSSRPCKLSHTYSRY